MPYDQETAQSRQRRLANQKGSPHASSSATPTKKIPLRPHSTCSEIRTRPSSRRAKEKANDKEQNREKPVIHRSATQPPSRKSDKSGLEYRVQGIPKAYDKERVPEVVSQALNLPPDTAVKVGSVALDPYTRRHKVATVSFSRTPECLNSTPEDPENEWTFEVPGSNDHNLPLSISVDTHFRGFTPLNSGSDSECQTDIIAVTGLGGHAFGSFKQSGGSHMWLRDSLPNDVPNARVLVFGYDSALTDPNSFRNLRDLGITLQRDINNIRHYELPSETEWDQAFNLKRPMILIGHSLGGIVIKQV